MSPIDTWTLVESPFDIRLNRHYEGLLAIGSGPLQQRAALEEGFADDPQDVEFLRIMGNVTVEKFPDFKSRVGTYLPGVSGPHPTCLTEMINLPMIHGLILFIGGQRVDMRSPAVRDYQRRLDLRSGRLCREFVWDAAGGAVLRLRYERFISAARPHVQALRCRVEHLAGPAVEIRVQGTLDAQVRTNGYDHFRAVDLTGGHEPITLAVRTDSGLDVAAAAVMTSNAGIPWSIAQQERWIALTGTTTLEPGRVLRLDKFVALTSSHHVAGPPLDHARRLAWDAAATGFERLAQESDAVWQERWARTDVLLDGDPRSQLALRVSLYHLLRAAVEDDPRCAIDAKGAAGEAYCGRYFWDTELFMLPMFLYTRPEVGKTLARFRVVSLPGARRNAQRLGYPGAKYAWESAPSGDESCPNWQYADHEIHITADVAYGLWHAHLCNPDDTRFLRELTEVVVETARYWSARVYWNAARGAHELLMVMGPDEYTPFSRNNAYTNRMAALALSLPGQALARLTERDPGAAAALRAGLGVTDAELTHWAGVARTLRRPYDAARGLVLQSDDFFDYEPLDFARWWPDRSRRIAAVVSQERLYRSRVLKQADVVQLMVLFPQEFSADELRTAYETYEPLTSHDSSLSKPMHAILAAWLGRDADAWRFWQESVGLDLTPGEAAEGIHAACAGANWQVAVLGFAGLRTRMQSDVLRLNPRLPAAWHALRFPIVWDGQPLYVTIEPSRLTLEHRGTRPLVVEIAGRRGTLAAGATSGYDLPHRA